MNHSKQLKELGYEVGVVSEGYTTDDGETLPTVYSVRGHGVILHVPDDDAEAWESLVDKKAHEHRRKFAAGDFDTEEDTFVSAAKARGLSPEETDAGLAALREQRGVKT